MSELVVRRASWSDWAAYRAIRLEALLDSPEAYGEIYSEASAQADGHWQDRVSNDDRPLYLALLGDRVVGTLSGGLNDDYPGTLWLYGMFVTAHARGTDAAPLLMEALADWCRDAGGASLHLFVNVEQRRAIAFYTKVGFVETGEVITMHRDDSLKLQRMEWTIG